MLQGQALGEITTINFRGAEMAGFWALGMAERGAGQRSRSLPGAVPHLASSTSVSVLPETGLWAGKTWNLGRVW